MAAWQRDTCSFQQQHALRYFTAACSLRMPLMGPAHVQDEPSVHCSGAAQAAVSPTPGAAELSDLNLSFSLNIG